MKTLHAFPLLAIALAAALPGAASAKPAQPAQPAPIMAGPGDGKDGPINQVSRPDGYYNIPLEEINVRNANPQGGTSGQSERGIGPNQPKDFSLSSSTPGSTLPAQVHAPSQSGLAGGPGVQPPAQGQSGSFLENTLVSSVVAPKPGAQAGASEKFIGGSDDGSSIRRKNPNRNRGGARGKRVRKP